MRSDAMPVIAEPTPRWCYICRTWHLDVDKQSIEWRVKPELANKMQKLAIPFAGAILLRKPKKLIESLLCDVIVKQAGLFPVRIGKLNMCRFRHNASFSLFRNSGRCSGDPTSIPLFKNFIFPPLSQPPFGLSVR
jgi:hypothetical protein